MKKVNVLDKHTAELIAAGEVVERSASVIKELVENSIDAGASAITVEIKNGGITFIRVSDSGEGISREDVPTVFLRHATSKIKTKEDLEEIGTLGFRGEALASIAAVSRVELLTRTADELAGTRYCIESGDELSLDDAGCPVGTTIIVRDLFFNTPARMKFLKKDVSEANAVSAVLDRIALSHSEISFRFIRDGKQTLLTPGNGDLKSCIYAVCGKEFADGLLPVDYKNGMISVTGFVSKPVNSRASRNMQYCFINGRYVKSRVMQVALEEACKGSIMVGKFPSCVLMLTIAKNAVDVNVHPAKTEVRFSDERPVFDAVYHAIKTALLKSDVISDFRLPKAKVSDISGVDVKATTKDESIPKVERKTVVSEPKLRIDMGIRKDYPSKPVSAMIRSDSAFHYNAIDIEKNDDEENSKLTESIVSESVKRDITEATYSAPKKEEAYYRANNEHLRALKADKNSEFAADINDREQGFFVNSDFESLKIVGEVFDTYILAEKNDEIIIIDKHAAHERLIYEKLKREKQVSEQYMLAPITVRLDASEYNALLTNTEILEQVGFKIEDFGNSTVVVRAFPMLLSGDDIASQITEIADNLIHNSKTVATEKLDWIYHNVACRAAIKGGNKSSTKEISALVYELLENPEVRYCPHGRPVFYSLRKREIEKQFGRV